MICCLGLNCVGVGVVDLLGGVLVCFYCLVLG